MGERFMLRDERVQCSRATNIDQSDDDRDREREQDRVERQRSANDHDLAEPGGERHGLVTRQSPGLTRCSGQRVERGTDTEHHGNDHENDSACLAVGACQEYLGCY